MIYHCCDPRRRERLLAAIDDGAAINGIDFLEVLDREPEDNPARQRTLILRFLAPAPLLTPDQIELSGGVRVTGIGIEWITRADAPDAPPAEPEIDAYLQALPEPDHVLAIRTSAAGDFSTYRLRFVSGPGALVPPAGIDHVLSEVAFSFKVECPSDFDCAPVHDCPEEPPRQPVLSYLAKDYQSFRRLMLGRMAQIMPGWQERSPADLGITLVEALAYTADRLSYAQDAAHTEAYLATARRRSSVRRHARLVDYRMDDGANARVWVHVATDADGVVVPAGTQFLTRLTGFDPAIPASAREAALARAPQVFEALHAKALTVAGNGMFFHEWSDAECCLPKGATRATLAGNFDMLEAGDVLVFEERLGPRTGRAADADPAKRHAVRLTAVQAGLSDDFAEGGPAEITEIRWAEEDALPFPLCLSALLDEAAGGGLQREVSHALGNILLADHGATIEVPEPLGPVPAPHLQLVPAGGGDPCEHPEPENVPPRFRPALLHGPVSQVAPFDEAAPSARAATALEGVQRQPKITLSADLLDWHAQPDLLQSAPEDRHFVLETEADQRGFLRFGDDRLGRRPASGTTFGAVYRVGNGRAGNVGAEAISHALTGLGQITRVRNPLPATGGRDPETMEEVRQAAPYAYRRQERAVTEEDYARMAERHRDVQRAAATFRWNGHGHTVFVTVDRFGGRPVTPEFEAELLGQLDPVRMAGYDLEIDAPRFVPLELSLFICAGHDHFRSEVRRAVFEALSAGTLPGGGRGFFHPDNFTFGTPLYLSALYAAVMAVEGVAAVEARLFRRRGVRNAIDLEAGVIGFGRLEILQLENDRNFPERGVLAIEMGGGK
ncbi:putative baseplate assembly protein [Salipiger sp. H15]|uniref:Baseplate assembly protein n=1 Tax=Alloyangia sp. H15 TaxID=3029062 RepID=A0AAU8AMI2_9RHOB